MRRRFMTLSYRKATLPASSSPAGTKRGVARAESPVVGEQARLVISGPTMFFAREGVDGQGGFDGIEPVTSGAVGVDRYHVRIVFEHILDATCGALDTKNEVAMTSPSVRTG
jgi:hypothetical protein